MFISHFLSTTVYISLLAQEGSAIVNILAAEYTETEHLFEKIEGLTSQRHLDIVV